MKTEFTAQHSGLSAESQALGRPTGVEMSRAKRLRVIAWVALPILAALYYGLLVAPMPHLPQLLALEFIYCTPIALTIVWGLRARALSEANERVFWGALAAANAMLLACELLLIWWVVSVSPAGPPRVSWPFHALHGVAALSFVAAAISLSRFSQAPVVSRVRWTLDIAAVSLVAAVLLLQFYVRPAMAPAGAPLSELLLGVAYPLFGLLMVAGTLTNVVGFKLERWRTWDRLVAVSLVVYAVAVSLWPIWYATASNTSRNYERGVLDLVQFSGHWLLMAAAVYRLTEMGDWHLRPLPPTSSRRRWVSALAPALMLMAIPFVGLQAYAAQGDRQLFTLFVAVLTVLTALALARSVMMALENGELFHLSVTDPLTGLHNHRFFQSRLVEEVGAAARYGEELSVILFDIDDFHSINARLGQAPGERLLREVAETIETRCGQDCVTARVGSDEFATVMPRCTLLEALIVARGVLDLVSIGVGLEPGTLTLSAGVASYPLNAKNAEDLVSAAKMALTEAKRSGRDTLVVFEDGRTPAISFDDRLQRLEQRDAESSVRALEAAVRVRDAAAHEHGRSVAELAARLGRRLGLSEDALSRLESGALLHDVGVIALSDDDRAQSTPTAGVGGRESRDASTFGQRILSDAGLGEMLPPLRSQQEWWDGSGHPDGLVGAEIPIEARILAVCDAYDILSRSTRPSAAPDIRGALNEIRSAAGSQFDPSVVDALFAEVSE